MRLRHEEDANPPSTALHHQPAPLDPDTICQPRQERIDRRKDAPVDQIRCRVRGHRPAVDRDGNWALRRREGWE